MLASSSKEPGHSGDQSVNHRMSTQSNIENSSMIQPPSQELYAFSERMTSREREHYEKALKEIYDAVKLRTRRLDTESASDRDADSEGIDITIFLQSTCKNPHIL